MSYNGWTNYETWATAAWLFNNESAYRIMRAIAEIACWHDDDEDNVTELAYAIYDYVMYLVNSDDFITDLFVDLIVASLYQVNWLEIAESVLEDY